jgi:ABC-type Fe3+ transport system permease subunit
MKTKLLFPALWAIVSLVAMLFEPVSLADFGVVTYFGYYLFFAVNAGTAAILISNQIDGYFKKRYDEHK